MFEAHLKGMGITDIFQLVSVGMRSGVLTVVYDSVSCRIVFREGKVVYASSDTQNRLGFRLVKNNVITENDLSEALDSQRRGNPRMPLATILLAQGCVDADVLARETQDHIQRVVRDVLTWKSGWAHFQPHEISDKMQVVKNGLSTEMLLIEAAVANDTENELNVDAELCDIVPGGEEDVQALAEFANVAESTAVDAEEPDGSPEAQ